MDYFIDSKDGDDTNSGLLPELAWKTIAKVNDFFSGDQSGNRICFHSDRGWKEQLDFNGQNVFGRKGELFVITSYGEGSLPSIQGSDRALGWTLFIDNIWMKNNFSDIQDVYYQSKRLKRSLSLEVMAESQTYYDVLSESIYLWLPNGENPNHVKVNVTARDYGIRLKTRIGYVVIENIYVHHHRHDAISVITYSNQATTDITIQNCHTAFAGVDADYSIDSSDGIVVYGAASDNRMRNLKIINNYSHHNLNCAVEIGKQDGALIAGNRFEYCSNGLELWRASSNCLYERNAVAHMNNENQLNRNYKEAGAWIHFFDGEESTNNTFRQNVFLNCKKGIQVWSGDVDIFQNSFVDVRLTAIDIKESNEGMISVNNNMMVVNSSGSVQGLFIDIPDSGSYTGDNNSFYSSNPKSRVVFKLDNEEIDFSQWKLDTGQDVASFVIRAVFPSDAPVSRTIDNDAWWVVK
ncbi:MAG: right-handed parallel beta-helix repeat-containing protein [Methylococcales bacterium]